MILWFLNFFFYISDELLSFCKTRRIGTIITNRATPFGASNCTHIHITFQKLTIKIYKQFSRNFINSQAYKTMIFFTQNCRCTPGTLFWKMWGNPSNIALADPARQPLRKCSGGRSNHVTAHSQTQLLPRTS